VRGAGRRYGRGVEKGLSAAQRKAVAGAEPATGRVAAREDVCAALIAAGLAVRHGRAGHRGVYLTSEGRRVREELAARAAALTEPSPDAREAPASDGREAPGAGRFRADDGSGAVEPGRARTAEVATAWEGLLQIRSVLGDGATEVPAAWERDRPVHAVALALEAAGVPPARPGASAGYRVRPSAHSGLAEITWSDADYGPTALARVAALLVPLGWQSTEHRTRDGSPYLLVSPRHG